MTVIIPAEEGHIYYDLKLSNPTITTSDGSSIPFYVKDNASRILTRQDTYKMAITGFQLDLDIPLMVIPIEEGINQNNRNLTIYSIAMRELTESGTQVAFEVAPVIFIPENSKSNPPPPPSQNNGVQDLTTDYYTYQSYQSFLDMINATIRDLIFQGGWAERFAGVPVRYPVLEYDNGLFKIRYSGEWVSDQTTYNIGVNKMVLEFNAPLKHLFSGFKYTRLNNGTLYSDHHSYYQINLKDNEFSGAADKIGDSSVNPEGLTTILSLTQEFDTRFRFNSISSIIITSDYIKVRPEYYPSVKNPNEIIDINNNFNTPYKNIISSFSFIDQAGNVSWQEQQYYVPSVLKFIDLTSSDSLDVIDARVYYQLKRGGLIPARVPVGSQSTIRFLFRKKTAFAD